MTDIREVQTRGARNQSLFREVNARVETLKNGALPLEKIDFICECWDEGCFVRVPLTEEEYLGVREHADSFFVAPGHIDLRIERVIAKRTTYWIVAKIGSGKAVAESLAEGAGEQSE